MSKLIHHDRISHVLSGMRADILEQAQCFFAGGTAIAMSLDNYRYSEDIDFVCSDTAGYRALRSMVGKYSMTGIATLFHKPVKQLREVRADRYGIRCVLDVDGAPIKFEIISEGRISLDPFHGKYFCGVPVIGDSDAMTEKLLANADRWLDRAVLSRDIIDLAAMVDSRGPIPLRAIEKAMSAYGSEIIDNIRRAAELLIHNSEYQEKCFSGLQIDEKWRRTLLVTLKSFAAGQGLENNVNSDPPSCSP